MSFEQALIFDGLKTLIESRLGNTNKNTQNFPTKLERKYLSMYIYALFCSMTIRPKDQVSHKLHSAKGIFTIKFKRLSYIDAKKISLQTYN